MGTLDDAIREHLELKRRSGTSDSEVERLESEALGPVRRETATPPAEPRAAASQDPEPEPVVPPPAGARPAPAPAPWLEDEPEEVPLGEARDHRRQPTSEFTAEEAAEASGRPPADYVAPDDEGEDLLEETPDFLQETPEHDRLWFEQRPPRDFDFDR